MWTSRGFYNYKSLLNTTFPIARMGRSSFPMGSIFSNVRLDNFDHIVQANGVVMSFHLLHPRTVDERLVLDEWKLKFVEVLDHWPSASPIKVTWSALPQMRTDFENYRHLVSQLTIPLCFVIIVFSISTACVLDWVYSKPFVALIGVVSPSLGLISAFGLGQLCGVKLPSVIHLLFFTLLSKQTMTINHQS